METMRDLHVKTRVAPPRNKNRVKRERKPINWRPFVTWASRAVCGILGVAVVGGAGYEAYRLISRTTFLKLETVEVSPLHRLTRDEIITEAGVRAGDPMLGLQLRRIGEQLAKNPWVKQVQVRRYFPHTLAIEVVERQPVAIVNLGLLYYLDAEGNVFKPLTQGDSLNYPVITGVSEDDLTRDPAGTKQTLATAVALMDLLKKSRTFNLADVSEIHTDKGFGFTLFTAAGGVPVRLGNDGFAEKLARFARIYGDLRGALAAVEYIDLDYHDKIIVKKG